MHHRSLLLPALAMALSAAASWAAPPPPGGGGARPLPPGYGSAAPYRPYRYYVGAPVYRSAWYGYPRYYGYGVGYGLGYGLGYGVAYGTGFGYGTGWSLSVGWPWYSYGPSYWGAPVVPYYYPYGAVVGTPPVALVDEDLVYVQQPPAATRPTPPGGGHWYYCTDPAGYFPYVQECSRPWMAVKPPPAATGR